MSDTAIEADTTNLPFQPFGPVCQIGYVVRDINRAIDYWLNTMGCGPVFLVENVKVRGMLYRGIACDPDLTVAYLQHGSLQFEFIQQNDDTPTPWREYLADGPEGMHHVAYWTQDFDRHMRLAAQRGLVPEMTGRAGGSGGNERFTYFRNDGPRGSMVELAEVAEPKRAFFDLVAGAAENWDGSDPIRRVIRT